MNTAVITLQNNLAMSWSGCVWTITPSVLFSLTTVLLITVISTVIPVVADKGQRDTVTIHALELVHGAVLCCWEKPTGKWETLFSKSFMCTITSQHVCMALGEDKQYIWTEVSFCVPLDESTGPCFSITDLAGYCTEQNLDKTWNMDSIKRARLYPAQLSSNPVAQ